MKTWIKKGADKIIGFMESADESYHAGEGWEEAPNDWNGTSGIPLSWLDENNRVIPEHIRIEKGIQKDHRGSYYDKETRQQQVIDKLDEEPGENLTKEVPLENEMYQVFDKQKNKWVIDTKKKDRAKKEERFNELDERIREIEGKQARPLREKELNIEADKAAKLLKEYQAEIEKIRPERNKLEEELKSA